MPSKRAANKKLINWWIREENAIALKEYAAKQGVRQVDLMEEALKARFQKWGLEWIDRADSKFSNREDRK